MKVFILVVVIILIFSMLPRSFRGFWTISDAFADEAGLERFILFFDAMDWKRKAPGYIVIQRDGQVIVNEPIVAKFGLYNPFTRCQTVTFLEFEVEGMPSTFHMKCDGQGKFLLLNKKKLWGVFYKDEELSEIKKTKK